MPIYEVDDGTGRIFSIESDYEPSEAELSDIISGYQPAAPQPLEYNANSFSIPAAPQNEMGFGESLLYGINPLNWPQLARNTYSDVLAGIDWLGGNLGFGEDRPYSEWRDIEHGRTQNFIDTAGDTARGVYIPPTSLFGASTDAANIARGALGAGAEMLFDPGNILFGAATAGVGSAIPQVAPYVGRSIAGLFGTQAAKSAAYDIPTELGTNWDSMTPEQRAMMIGEGVFSAAAAPLMMRYAARSPDVAIEPTTLSFNRESPLKTAQEISEFTPIEFYDFRRALGEDTMAEQARVGTSTSPEILTRFGEQADAAARDLMQQGRIDEALSEATRGQFFRESIRESQQQAQQQASKQDISLDDIYERFKPEPPKSTPIGQLVKEGFEKVRTGFSSRFRPLDRLAEDIAKAYEQPAPKRVAHIFEQLKGSSGKAEADIYRFDRDVAQLVEGAEKDFNAYVFIRRSLDRLNQDAADIQAAMAGEDVPSLNRRRVAGYTIPQLEAQLAELQAKIGPEKTQQFEAAANAYQQHLDSALRLQVESGRMSPEVYDKIKSENQFYAPFKILKYLDESSRPEGSGRKVDTVADYTKAMTGIDSPDFKVGDMLAAARQNIALSRVLSDKNLAMQKFADMADADANNLFVQKLKADADIPQGMEVVNVMRNGKTERYAVDKDVSQSVQMNPSSEAVDLAARILGWTGGMLRAGATTGNVAFQIRNLAFADTPRAALESKYGVRQFQDMVRYPLEFADAFVTSMGANLLKNKQRTVSSPVDSAIQAVAPDAAPLEAQQVNNLYMDFLDSGAAGAVIQDYFTPKTLTQTKPKWFGRTVLDSVGDFNRAIEESSKLIGIKRAMRFEGAKSGADLQARFPEAVTEIRRFSGSPDFGRNGAWTEALKLSFIMPFFNARTQGGVSSIGRGLGRDGKKAAARTWLRVGTTIGAPTAALWYYNNLPQNKADYEQRPKWEKDNYWLIPNDGYIEDENGDLIRDYTRIPKRETTKLAGNMVEAAMEFMSERNPEAVAAFGSGALEGMSPVQISGDSLQERVESFISGLNPILKVPTEVATGRDTFRHRDIIPQVMEKASPEQQYTDRTPELYKIMADLVPDAASESLRSPLMMEAIVQGFTANLIRQFTPKKPIKGRESNSDNPIANSIQSIFQSVPYVDSSKEREAIGQLEREAADAFLAKDRAARSLLKSTQDPREIIRQAFQTYGTNENTVDIIERASDLFIAEKNGITREERMVLNLPVEQRAKYVIGKLSGLDTQSRISLLEDLQKKRILTQAVIQEIGNQIRATQTPP